MKKFEYKSFTFAYMENVNAEEKLNVGLAVNGKYIGFLLRLEGILGD